MFMGLFIICTSLHRYTVTFRTFYTPLRKWNKVISGVLPRNSASVLLWCSLLVCAGSLNTAWTVLPSAEDISRYGALRRRRIVEAASEEWSFHRCRGSDDHAAFDERFILSAQKRLVVRRIVCFDFRFVRRFIGKCPSHTLLLCSGLDIDRQRGRLAREKFSLIFLWADVALLQPPPWRWAVR